jgi:S-adenosylhomocysteine hydrolase
MRMALKCKGVSEVMTTGVHRLKEMAAKGIAFPGDQREGLRDEA